ncbi:MAG: dual specificity protein phosphatase family protein [Proteobacteria bacterium]|nr:dual specificity protein phosphatase family protein [Pseudomonadota bacterium]
MINTSYDSEKVFLYKQWDENLSRYTLEKGSITMMPKPVGGLQLAPYIEFLKNRDIEVLVSLLQFDEINTYSLVNEGYECEAQGIEFINFQIKDHDVPQFFVPFNQLVEKLSADLIQGRNIAIHCYAGIGRTGMLASSLLIKQGAQVDEALINLSKVRGLRVPETIQQISWLHHHADELSVFSKS